MRVGVFDTETTGLVFHPDAKDGVQPRCIEFGGVVIDESCGTLRELSLLINPGVPLDAIITKITGLTDESLASQPSFVDVEPVVRDFFSDCDAVLAHNLPFDMDIIDMELRRHELQPMTWPDKQICTVQEHAEEWGARPRLKQLYEFYTEQPLAQTHRALDDVMALVEVVRFSEVLKAWNSRN